MWKFLYYAPNTLRILGNKKLKEEDKKVITDFELDPRTKGGLGALDGISPPVCTPQICGFPGTLFTFRFDGGI